MPKATAETVDAAGEKVDLTKVTPAEAGKLAVDAAIVAAVKEAQESGRTVSEEDAPSLVSDETKHAIFNQAADDQAMFLKGVAEAAEALPAQQAAIAETADADATHQAEIAKAAAAEAVSEPGPTPGDEPVKINPDAPQR